MMKLHLIYMTLWTAAQAGYPSRVAMVPNMNNLMSGMNLKSNSHQINQGRLRIAAFRPGVIMRPWSNPRFTPAASNRVPYVLYRNQQNGNSRFAVKPYAPGRVYVWKSRLSGPAPPSPPAPRHHDGGTGAIHTIPAPNLSLSEKPIVVADDSSYYGATSESQRVAYEVTEKTQTQAPSLAQMPAKIEQPIGFSKTSSLTTPELHSIVRNGGSVHFPNEHLDISQFGLQYPQITQHLQTPIHQNSVSNLLPQNIVAQPFLPQEYRVSNPNDQMIQAGPDGIVISPNALYQPDPDFLQKLQTQLLQRFPGVEFVPYPADVHGPVKPVQTQTQTQIQPQPFPQASQVQQQFQQSQPPLFLLQNEQYIRPVPIPQGFVAIEPQKSLSQRQTQESAVVTLVPLVVNNATEKRPEVVTSANQINTPDFKATESRPETTTIKFVVETTTEQEKTSSPIYLQFAPVPERPSSHQISDQNTDSSNNDEVIEPIKPEHNVSKEIGSLYSALNDFRAVITLEEESRPRKQVQPLEDTTSSTEAATTTTTTTTTTISSTTTAIPTTTTVKQLFIPQPNQIFKNQSVFELKPLPGAPFAKSPNSVNVAYTLQASDNKNTKVAKDGSVYAGQIVEGSVSEDQDFIKEKANFLSRRAPIRLTSTTDNREAGTASNATRSVRGHEKITVVKAKIPSKSKLTFDDKTGEPVLRIYASYVGTPSQKEAIASKLSNAKNVKEVTRKQDNVDSWKGSAVKALAKPFEPNPNNQVTQFGLKLRARSDDYIPLFDDDYEV